MTDVVEINGGTIKLDPFQTVVAFDFPAGDEFLEIRHIQVAGTLQRRYTITLKGDQRAGAALDDDGQGFDSGGEPISTLGLIDFFGQTGIYSSATSFPGADTPCYTAGAISTPGGYTIFTFGDGAVIGTPTALSKFKILNNAGVAQSVHNVGENCGLDGAGTSRYHKE